MHRRTLLPITLLAALFTATATAHAVERPFMLWTKQEAAELKKTIESEPWAKKKYEEMLASRDRGKTFRNLFRYTVMGDVKAGEEEKKYLLGIVGTHPRTLERLEHGGRHYTCYLDALRYDAVYDLLTPEERAKVEKTFREYIDYQLEDKKTYTRTSWLPNMQWPRPMSAHIMAAALADKPLIEKLINSNGGWKWYLDHYITSEGFYMEEFGKHYSMIGEMLLFCRALEKQGLDEWGYGYTGTGGATMRKYVESITLAGFPRVTLPGGMPVYPKVTMGDARSNYTEGTPPYAFQHAIVYGFTRQGVGGTPFWGGANMNGRDHKNAKVDKLMTPQWFEIAHAKWPDAGFDYFLANMRKPDQDKYYPTLLWLATPIDPATAKAPAAPSYVSDERGFALLRANESPAYWESPDPAVALQLGMYYVHYTVDCFSLLGYYAHNRPIYINRGIADGYAGADPWTDHVRGHAGVVVDNLRADPIGQVPTRFARGPIAKFVAATDDPAVSGGTIKSADNKDVPHTRGIYPGVTQTRALLLTKEYLFDVTALTGTQTHTYHWQTHALGVPTLPDTFKPTNELDADALYMNANAKDWQRILEEEKAAKERKERYNVPMAVRQYVKAKNDPERYLLGNVKKLTTDAPATVKITQSCATGDPANSLLGPDWYNRAVGVRIAFLPEPGTELFVGDSAQYRHKEGVEKGKGESSTAPNEVGGTTVLVQRKAPSTTFVALHDPFQNNAPAITGFERIAQTDTAVAARVQGNNLNDRVLVQTAFSKDPVTLAGDGESFTFHNYGIVRITKDTVHVEGPVTALTLKVEGNPKLVINGKETPATLKDNLLHYNNNP